MQKQMRHRGQQARARLRVKPQSKSTFCKRAFAAFCQLSEPAQTVLIVGLFLLLAWLIAHPLLLASLIKVFMGMITVWVTLKQV